MLPETTNLKMMLILRKDLGMRKGKMTSQGAHVAVRVVLALQETPEGRALIKAWITDSAETKITVSVDSEAELWAVYETAKACNLPCAIVQDIGKTEFHGIPTYTALAIGPARESALTPITGNLPLL